VPACQLLSGSGRLASKPGHTHCSTSASGEPHNLPLATSMTPLMRLVMFVQVKEVGDGNINYVYVLEGPAGSLCLKQGHPYVRIMKSWKLSQVCRSGEQEPLTLVHH
jgi:hypothetical protein